nr:MAG TPA: hypothetical protein [Caudoviricetes sp.]
MCLTSKTTQTKTKSEEMKNDDLMERRIVNLRVFADTLILDLE